ncbi:MAG: hypothetical protein MPJ25_11200, partial [Pirellulales bacterium]|nr:hypothetical protein [Pirellulales bacterium]
DVYKRQVYNVSTGAFVTNGNVDITGTTTLADVTVSFVNTDTTQYRAIYQPLSSLTGGETFREGNQLWTPNTDGNATVTPNNDTALTGGTATDRTSDITFSVTGAGTTSNAISLVFAVTGALNNIQAREFALAARNNVSYINAIYDRRLAGNQPIIEFQQPFVTSYNGQEGSTAGAAIQQVYTIAPSDNIGSQTGMASTIGYIPGNNSGGFSFFSPQQINISASIPDVITAIDSSNTGTRVSDIDNKTSYLVTDGSDSTTGTVPTTTDSRLVGIKPKNAEYNRDANYVTNT